VINLTSFKDKAKEIGGANLLFLSEDGEIVTFVVMGDPIAIKGKFQSRDTTRVAIPIWTEDGFQLFVTGVRNLRKIAKLEKHFKTKAIDVIRKGEPGDTSTKYSVTCSDNTELTEKLFKDSKGGIDKDDLAEAIESAKESAS